MFKILLLTLFSLAVAQAQTLNGGSGNALPGEPVTVPISLAANGSAISGLQFEVVIPAGQGVAQEIAGAASRQATKTVSCVTSAGVHRCIMFGLNQTALADGPVVDLSFTTDAGFVNAVNVTLANLAASDPAGAAVAITAGTPLSLLAGVPCPDPNGDGLTNILDVQLTVNAVLGGQCTGP